MKERGKGKMRRVVIINLIIISFTIALFGILEASSRLIATEEEVKQFLAKYIDRYVNKDIEGFLSLFSKQAVQNHKENKEEIRKIYSHFFNESLNLQLKLEGLKIELYENAAEVRATYQIDQIRKESGDRRSWRGRIRWLLGKESGTLKIVSLEYRHQKTS